MLALVFVIGFFLDFLNILLDGTVEIGMLGWSLLLFELLSTSSSDVNSGSYMSWNPASNSIFGFSLRIIDLSMSWYVCSISSI